MFKRIANFFDNIEEYIIIVLFSIILVILGTTVVTRYVFSYTPSWAEQTARIMFVWVTYAGISLAARKHMHLRVTAINMVLPQKARAYMLLVGDLIGCGVAGFLAYRIFVMTMSIFQRGQVFAAIPMVPVWIMYIAGALGMTGMVIRYLQAGIIPTIRDLLAGKDPTIEIADQDQF